jgi:hypothetical protein
MKKLVFILGLVLLAASVGFLGYAGTGDETSGESSTASISSVSFDGRWTGSTEIEGFGTIPLGYDFKSDGNKLTGTTDGQLGPIPIANGIIDGNRIRFEVTINFGGQDIVVDYIGVLIGDKLKLNWPGQGGRMEEAICTRQ